MASSAKPIEPARPTVLLVEDEALLRMIIADELLDAGYSVVEASDGQRALEMLTEQPSVGLLFTDIRMPGGLSGWDVAEQARALRPNIPVFYATGFSEDAPRLVPGARFFKKPYRASAIVDAARELGVLPSAT
jgi:CheY-like chemotaxis protein